MEFEEEFFVCVFEIVTPGRAEVGWIMVVVVVDEVQSVVPVVGYVCRCVCGEDVVSKVIGA